MKGRAAVIVVLAGGSLVLSLDVRGAPAPLGLTPSVEAFGQPCGYCTYCNEEETKMEAEEHPAGLFWPQQCIEHICDRNAEDCHIACPFPPCPPPPPPGGGGLDEAEFLAVWNALVKYDKPAIRKALAAHPDRLIVNERRSAIQIIGCSGSVIASVPLSARRLAALLRNS